MGPSPSRVLSAADDPERVDIGCGEAPWFAHLHALRPKIRYAGYDPSEYVVSNFGASRNGGTVRSASWRRSTSASDSIW